MPLQNIWTSAKKPFDILCLHYVLALPKINFKTKKLVSVT